jgi:TMEM175 potassium channel family protein
VITVFFNVLWRYAVRRQLLDKGLESSASMISRQYAAGPLMYVVCMALAFVDVRASLGLNVALAIYFALPPSLVRRKS